MGPSVALFGPKARFHHLGIAVRSIEDTQSGLVKVIDPVQSVTVAFMQLGGQTLELIEPLGENSPVNQNLKDGNRLVHFCIEVPDLEEAVEICSKANFLPISKAQPAVAFDLRKILWVFNQKFGLVELLEDKSLAE